MSKSEAETVTPMDQEGVVAGGQPEGAESAEAADGVLQLFSGIQESFQAEQDIREVWRFAVSQTTPLCRNV